VIKQLQLLLLLLLLSLLLLMRLGSELLRGFVVHEATPRTVGTHAVLLEVLALFRLMGGAPAVRRRSEQVGMQQSKEKTQNDKGCVLQKVHLSREKQ
jgi:hypothetical protein